MISNIYPGIVSPFSPYVAFFQRAGAGVGLADNYVPGQTVAEMFSIPTTYPVYLTVVIPSNCYIYDSYGYHDEDDIWTYTPGPSGVVGALRFDDLHEDSLVLILNNGEISGAGGDGGIGMTGYNPVVGTDAYYTFVGSGGGGGRGRAGTKGGAHGYHTEWSKFARWDRYIYDQPAAVEPEPGGGFTAADGTDGDGDAAGVKGGTDDYWYVESESVTDYDAGIYCIAPDVNLAAFNANFSVYMTRLSRAINWTNTAIQNQIIVRANLYKSYNTMPPMCMFNTKICADYFDSIGWTDFTPPLPGYEQSHKAIFAPQPGTAAIVLGCKTYIHNSESVGKLGYIFGGGGGGVGGDLLGVTGLGFDGGDWGANGGGPNYQGFDGGLAGKAVHKNGKELIWIEGYNGTQVKGLVT